MKAKHITYDIPIKLGVILSAHAQYLGIDKGISGVIKPKSSIFDDNLAKVIGTALVMPTCMFNDAIGRLREEVTSGYPVQPTPLTELLGLCSIYQLEQNLKDVTDDVLTKCFYDAAILCNGFTPLIGWLRGYDEYPPIPDNAPLMSSLKWKNATSKERTL